MQVSQKALNDALNLNSTKTDSLIIPKKRIKYRVLKIATILGANASGKTNIIRAFSLLHDLILEPCKNKNSKIAEIKLKKALLRLDISQNK